LTLPPIHEVLLGRATINASRDDRHPLDSLLARWRSGEPWRSHLTAGFASLIVHPDLDLAAAAIHFFCERPDADDGGGLLAARNYRLGELEGRRSPWYPDDGDLRDLLFVAIGHRVAKDTKYLEAARQELLVPGRGRAIVPLMFARDRSWFDSHAAEILGANPGAASAPLGFIAMSARWSESQGELHIVALTRALVGARYAFPPAFIDALAKEYPGSLPAFLRALNALDVDLRPLLPALRDRFGAESLRDALLTLPDELKRLAYLAAV